MVEYCVSLVSSIPPLVNARFPDAALSDKLHTNKLAVCLGDGSKYDKHCEFRAALPNALPCLPVVNTAHTQAELVLGRAYTRLAYPFEF